MRMMALHWLATMAITFAVRQLAKFGKETDWNKVKADADARIRDLVPGEFFDEFAVAFLNKVLDLCKEMMVDEANMTQLFTLIAEGKLNDAINLLMAWVRQHMSF